MSAASVDKPSVAAVTLALGGGRLWTKYVLRRPEGFLTVIISRRILGFLWIC
jgi:hypothetical protein